MNFSFVFASGTLLAALVLTVVGVNQLLKWLRERMPSNAFGNWLSLHESSLILSAWAALIAALFFFGPRLLLLITTYADTMLD